MCSVKAHLILHQLQLEFKKKSIQKAFHVAARRESRQEYIKFSNIHASDYNVYIWDNMLCV